MSKSVDTKRLIKIVLSSALTVIGSYMIIPLLPIPISPQSLFTIASGCYLSKKYTNTPVLLHTVLDPVGLPVLTGGKGGMQTVFSPGFGYIIGFLVQTFYVRLKNHNLSKLSLFIMFMISSLIIYCLGVIYMGLFFKLSNKQFDLWKLLFTGMIIFLPSDMLEASVFSFLTKGIEKYI